MSKPVEAVHPRQRARRTNAPGVPPSLDGRSTEARRHRDLYAAAIADLGRAATVVDRALLDRFVSGTIYCEQVEAERIKGKVIDEAKHNATLKELRLIRAELAIRSEERDTSEPADELRSGWRAP